MNAAALIPCFNEGQTIGIVVSQMRRHVERVIVVDDGSTDKTNTEARAAGAIVLSHGQNFGKGAALKTGLSYLYRLGYEWAFTLDGDGQHDPADAPALRQCAGKTPALLIVGNRMGNAKAMPKIRRLVNAWMSDKLSQHAGCTLPDTQCGYRLIHLQTWSGLPFCARRFEVESEMLMAFLAARLPVKFVPVRVIAGERRSRIRPLADSIRWWKWWRQLKERTMSPCPSRPLDLCQAPGFDDMESIHPSGGG